MCDKTSSNLTQNAARIIVSASRNPARRRHALTLAVLPLVFGLILRSEAFALLEQKQSTSSGATPSVEITEVRALPALNDEAKTDIEIRWTLQVPKSTTIDQFEVLLEVRYSDGSKGIERSERLKSSARAVILRLATNPPKNRSAVLKKFKAAVNLKFRITSSGVAQHARFIRSGSIERPSARLANTSGPN